MIALGPIETFLVAHKDALGVVISAVGSAAIIVAALQLGESQRQRGIAESLQLFEKLDQQLAAWSASALAQPLDDHALAIAVGRLLSTYEIASDGINKSYLSRMAAELVVSHMIDSLPMIMGHTESRAATSAIAQNERVYSAIKILLLGKIRKLLARDGAGNVRQTFFQGQPQGLFDLDMQGWLRRRRLAFALRG